VENGVTTNHNGSNCHVFSVSGCQAGIVDVWPTSI
jgi:hypothetical protein